MGHANPTGPSPGGPAAGGPARWLLALGLAAPLAFFWRALLLGEVLYERDVLRVYYPVKVEWARRVAEGQLPQWFPWDALGQPYVGMLVSGAFHPTNLFWLVLGPGAALTASVLVCYPVALLGTRALLRAVGTGEAAACVGALGFTFCGGMLASTNNPLYLQSAALVPAALWAALRSRERAGFAVASAAFIALQLLAGDPMTAGVTCAAAVLVALPRPRRALALAALAAGLSAAQWVPVLAIRSEAASARNTELEALTWSAHPLRLLELAVGPLFVAAGTGEAKDPGVWDRTLGAQAGQPWVSSHLVGTALAAFALVGVVLSWRRGGEARRWVGAWVLVVLLWLGRFGGLFALLHRWVPGAQALRFPEKLWPFVTLGVAAAAAVGLSRADAVPRRWIAGAGLALALAFAAAGAAVGGPPSAALLAAGATAGVVAAGWGVAGTASRRALLVGLASLAQLSWAHRALVRTASGSVLEDAPALVDAARPFAASARLLSTLRGIGELQGAGDERDTARALLMLNTAGPVMPALWGVESTAPYLPAFHERARAVDQDPTGWAPLVSAGLRVLGEGAVRPPMEPLARLAVMRLSLARDPAALPRAYLATPVWLASPPDPAEVLGDARVRAGEVAYVEAAPQFEGEAARGSVAMVRRAPERVELDVRSAGPAVAVLTDAWYSGWTATVDGSEVPVWPANRVLRAVPVPAGVHRVVLSYAQPGLGWGLGLSGATLLVCAAAAALRRRAARRPGRTAGLRSGAPRV